MGFAACCLLHFTSVCKTEMWNSRPHPISLLSRLWELGKSFHISAAPQWTSALLQIHWKRRSLPGGKKEGKKKVVYCLCIWVCALSPSSPIRLFILLRLCVRVGVSARKKNHGLFVFPARRLFWLLDFDLSTSWSGGSSICAWQTVLALRTWTGEKATSSVSIAALRLEYLTSFRPF